MARKVTLKQSLIAECGGLGLATNGTVPQLRARIDAYEEAQEDTANALTARTVVSNGKTPKRIDPAKAAIFGTGIAVALNAAGLL